VLAFISGECTNFGDAPPALSQGTADLLSSHPADGPQPCLACTICNKRLDSYNLVEHEEQVGHFAEFVARLPLTIRSRTGEYVSGCISCLPISEPVHFFQQELPCQGIFSKGPSASQSAVCSATRLASAVASPKCGSRYTTIATHHHGHWPPYAQANQITDQSHLSHVSSDSESPTSGERG